MNIYNTQSKSHLIKILLFILVVSQGFTSFAQTDGKQIEHGVVFSEDGKYGGWPANHGIWSWGNEILVGFVEAPYNETAPGMHTYDIKSSGNKYARSLDGGVTWTITDAFEIGQKAWGHDNNISPEKAVKPIPLTAPIADFTDPEFILTFLRHNNHYGPSHFYYSNNKGKSWEGAFIFPDMGTPGIANRTDYIVDGKQSLSVFITAAKSNKREGRVALARTEDGGLNWNLISWVTPEHGGFDIMPSSLRLSESELLTTIRTRTENGTSFISSYKSTDNGKTWKRLKNPAPDTGAGGSPPALTQLKDGRLALGYINRSNYGSRVHVRFSDDNGETWGNEITLRSGDGANRDAGYPRLTQNADGKLVMVYYWNNVLLEGSKPYRYIASTIFDPNDWK
ncbi:sialidase family protein [Kriegella aquimaris]|uniref:BNR repeat-like domain-containing protein n=1 Tax=Kriegella aquimaris TaxID=192904 RepID=A0A1G9KI94_9FLAO|nr:sialidase family protein [Kriegella aquimaris]SDL49332.1 BNR repeat-like domain-containing protein [Kriegella aquimaris]